MSTTDTFIYVLAAVLLLPLIPAFLLYKFLPSKTSVAGPFKGLNLKLTGAFGGYFLLVLTAIGVFFPLLKNDQAKTIEQQNEKIKQLENTISNQQQWVMKGYIASTSPKQTKVFFDEKKFFSKLNIFIIIYLITYLIKIIRNFNLIYLSFFKLFLNKV